MQKLSWDEIHRVEHYLGVETEALFRYFDGEDNQKAGDLYDLDDDFSEDIEGVALQIAATARAGLAH